MTSVRLFLGVPIAATVTIGLFILMMTLIQSDNKRPDEVKSIGSIEFVRKQKDTDIRQKERLDRPERQAEPPPPPPMDLAEIPKPRARLGDTGTNIKADVNLSPAGGFAAPTDTDVQPLVRVPPVYPARAQGRGIEGWVEVEFSILPDGSVADPRVVQADPPSMFDRAALSSILKWRYKPQTVNGEPVRRNGVRVVISFKMEN